MDFIHSPIGDDAEGFDPILDIGLTALFFLIGCSPMLALIAFVVTQ